MEGQTLPDEFMEAEVEKGRVEGVNGDHEDAKAMAGAGESRRSEKPRVAADLRDPEHKNRCPFCGEWVGRLHGGALYLYVKDGRLIALADMDHVYGDCKRGLIENIRFLYRLMDYLEAMGYEVLAVGKAYDDLYAWVRGGGEDVEYEGLRVFVARAPRSVEDFERFAYGFQRVDGEVLEEALDRESSTQTCQP